MAQIKKAFQPIMSLLAANMSATVGDIYEQALALTKAAVGAGGGSPTTFHRDEAGNVVAVRCAYFGKWFKPSEMPFGEKKNSASGLNPYSKEGMSKWTKQLAEANKARESLLDRVASGEIAPDAIEAEKLAIEENRARIEAQESDAVAYDTLEDLLATLA